MEYDYVVMLKKTDYRFIDQVSHLLHVFALLTFGYFAYLAPGNSTLYLVVIIAIIASWTLAYVKKRKTGFALYRIGLMVAAAGWFFGSHPNIAMGILYAVCGLLEKQVKFPQEIGVSKEGVTFNTFPKKKLAWNELTNMVLKDGLLTIDQKNNKLFQKEVDETVSPEIEQEFNAFCRERIGSEE